MTEDGRLSPRLEEWIAQCEAMGQTALAAQYRKALELVEADRREFWNTPLNYTEAHEWGGMSVSQLRRLVNDGTIPAVNGRIRRVDVPVMAGHSQPLAIDDVDPQQHWTNQVSDERRAS